MSLSVRNFNFTAFACEHNEPRFFSHPFVPLNSVNYPQQYYFTVPDEHGNAIDAVKSDMAHCTFEPALGTAFDTEGEVTVKVTYHREYTVGGAVRIVEKSLAQKITVVDHGEVIAAATSNYQRDLYEDGYVFWRPYLTTAWNSTTYRLNGENRITKSSSIPWRATALAFAGTYTGVTPYNFTDISELAYADISTVTNLDNLFRNCTALTDISPVKDWDVSKVTAMDHAFDTTGITSIEPLRNWDVSSCTRMQGLFYLSPSIASFEPIKDWDVSKCTLMNQMFYGDILESVEFLRNWDVSSCISTAEMFKSNKLTDLSPLANWNVGNVQNFMGMFQWPVYTVVNNQMSFCGLRDISPLRNWDVSKGKNFNFMFDGHLFINDLEPIGGWDMSSATSANEMLGGNVGMVSVSALKDWRLPNMTGSMQKMVGDYWIAWSGMLQKFVYHYAWGTVPEGSWLDSSGYYHPEGTYGTLSIQNKDASAASNWGVPNTGKKCFGDAWENKPSWN